MPTPHNEAKLGDFAKSVLMPGDPKRAEYIAKNFLENPKLVNNVRGISGFTGVYNGKPISVMASGMGIPSIAIYSKELFCEYGVEQIIRIGSAGAIQENIDILDIVIAMTACSNSSFYKSFGIENVPLAPSCDYELLNKAVIIAKNDGLKYHVGTIFSSDTFYDETNVAAKLKKMNVLAVEMETIALYLNAARYNKKALSICTISDSLNTKKELTALEREQSLNEMIKLALDVCNK